MALLPSRCLSKVSICNLCHAASYSCKHLSLSDSWDPALLLGLPSQFKLKKWERVETVGDARTRVCWEQRSAFQAALGLLGKDNVYNTTLSLSDTPFREKALASRESNWQLRQDRGIREWTWAWKVPWQVTAALHVKSHCRENSCLKWVALPPFLGFYFPSFNASCSCEQQLLYCYIN